MLARRLQMSGRSRPYIVSYAFAEVTTSDTLVIAKPTGTIDGDLLLAVMAQDTITPHYWTGDTGWTEEADQGVIGAGPNLRLASKIAASEGASYSFVNDTALDNVAGYVICIRNASIDAVGAIVGVDASGGTSLAAASTSALGLLIAVYANGGQAITWTTPTGMTPLANDTNATGPSWALFYEVTNTAATGTRTSTTSSDAFSHAGILIGLKGV